MIPDSSPHPWCLRLDIFFECTFFRVYIFPSVHFSVYNFQGCSRCTIFRVYNFPVYNFPCTTFRVYNFHPIIPSCKIIQIFFAFPKVDFKMIMHSPDISHKLPNLRAYAKNYNLCYISFECPQAKMLSNNTLIFIKRVY